MKAQIAVLKTRIKMQTRVIAELQRQVASLREIQEKDREVSAVSIAKLKQDLEWKKSLLVKRNEIIRALKEVTV